ncbi:hypothetical protein RQP46_009497 [Phenoliferia psychrophenolica]
MLPPSLRSSLRARVPLSFRALSSSAPSSSESPLPIPSTSTLPPTPALSTPAYSIKRTSSGFLPVYMDVKSGGQRLTTIVRKVDGDLNALRRDLTEAMPNIQVYTKPAARQVVLRGDWVQETKEWLGERGF